jgi:hypothetical protein
MKTLTLASFESFSAVTSLDSTEIAKRLGACGQPTSELARVASSARTIRAVARRSNSARSSRVNVSAMRRSVPGLN